MIDRSLSTLSTCVAGLLALLAVASPTRAANTASSTEKLLKIGSISAQSLDRLTSEVKELGIDLPENFTKSGIEAQFPFIGANALDPGRPIGLVLFAGPQTERIEAEDMVAVLPMKPRTATLKSFYDAGGKAVEGSPGTVLLNGAAVRRTASSLIVGHDAQAVGAVRDSDIIDLYRGRTQQSSKPGAHEVIVRGSMDVVALRQVMPEKFNRVFSQVKLATLLKTAGKQYGQETLFTFLDQMTRLDFGLAQSGEEISLNIGLAPIEVPKGGTFAKPGLPQEVILRFDMGAPPLKALPWLTEAARQLGSPRRFAAPANSPGDLSSDLAEAFLGGEAVSLGIAPGDNFDVLYMVQQHVQGDPAARFKQIAEKSQLAAAYAIDQKNVTHFEFSQYTASPGLRVARLQFMEGTKCTFCVDAFRRGDTVFLAGSSDQGRYVASLLDEKPQGTFSGLLNGSLSLGAALAIIEDGLPKNAVSASQLKKLHDIFHDQFLTLSATGEPDEVVFGLSLPREVMRGLIGLYQPGGKN